MMPRLGSTKKNVGRQFSPSLTKNVGLQPAPSSREKNVTRQPAPSSMKKSVVRRPALSSTKKSVAQQPAPSSMKKSVARQPALTLEEAMERLWQEHQQILGLSEEHCASMFLDVATRLAVRKVKAATFEQAAGAISPEVYAMRNAAECRLSKELQKVIMHRAKALNAQRRAE